METLLYEIKQDHDEAREFLLDIEHSLETNWEELKNFYSLLCGHQRAEEKIIFPIIEGYDEETEELIGYLIEDHTESQSEIKSMLDSNEFDLSVFPEFKESLLRHMFTEENGLFMKARQTLTEEQLRELAVSFREVVNREKNALSML